MMLGAYAASLAAVQVIPTNNCLRQSVLIGIECALNAAQCRPTHNWVNRASKNLHGKGLHKPTICLLSPHLRCEQQCGTNLQVHSASCGRPAEGDLM